jgi:hypothetical protein
MHRKPIKNAHALREDFVKFMANKQNAHVPREDFAKFMVNQDKNAPVENAQHAKLRLPPLPVPQHLFKMDTLTRWDTPLSTTHPSQVVPPLTSTSSKVENVSSGTEMATLVTINTCSD